MHASARWDWLTAPPVDSMAVSDGQAAADSRVSVADSEGSRLSARLSLGPSNSIPTRGGGHDRGSMPSLSREEDSFTVAAFSNTDLSRLQAMADIACESMSASASLPQDAQSGVSLPQLQVNSAVGTSPTAGTSPQASASATAAASSTSAAGAISSPSGSPSMRAVDSGHSEASSCAAATDGLMQEIHTASQNVMSTIARQFEAVQRAVIEMDRLQHENRVLRKDLECQSALVSSTSSLNGRMRNRNQHAIVSSWLAPANTAASPSLSDGSKPLMGFGFAQSLPPFGSAAVQAGMPLPPPVVQVTPPDKFPSRPMSPEESPPQLGSQRPTMQLELPYTNLATIRSQEGDNDSSSSESIHGDDSLLPGKKSAGFVEDIEERRISACSQLMSLEGMNFEVLGIYNKSRKSTLKRLWMGQSAPGGSSRQNSTGQLGSPQGGSHRMSLAAGQIAEIQGGPAGRSMTMHSIIMEEDDDTLTRRQRCAKKIMVHPNARGRAIWDLLSLILVSYDTITIPMELLEPKSNWFTDSMAWITRLFWTCDMPASFCTGFVSPTGVVEMRFREVVRRYTRSWLILDVLVVTIDWFEVFATVHSSLGYARVGKASRIFRILRLIRLMRLIKMGQVVKLLTERIFSEFLIIVFDIVKSLMIIVGVAHLAACVWYGIGAAPDPDELSWMNSMPAGFTDRDLSYRYFTVLHWALSQFSGGMSEMSPTNFWERFYNIMCYLLAFVVAAIFVSSLTSSMTRLIVIGSQQSTQTALLRRYLLQNNISSGLAWRIQRNANFAMSEREKNMHESQIEMLQIVSGPLRVELHFEIYIPVLTRHRFFLRYTEECPQVMRKVCHGAVAHFQVSHGDVVFSFGENPSEPKVYFPKSGELEYMKMDGSTSVVDNKMWVAEAVLWTSWTHRGQLTAMTDCQITVLKAKAFQDIVVEFEHHMFDPKTYASEFVADLNRCEQTEITDLPFLDPHGHFARSLRRFTSDVSLSSSTSSDSRRSGRPSEGARGLVQEVAHIIQVGVHSVEERIMSNVRRLSNFSDASAFAPSAPGSQRPSTVSRIASAPASRAGSRRPSAQTTVAQVVPTQAVPNTLSDLPDFKKPGSPEPAAPPGGYRESQYGTKLTVKGPKMGHAASS